MPRVHVVPDRFYYLTHFHYVMEWIAERYADLLRAPEREFLSVFPTLPRPARALLVRMIMRRRVSFRDSHLCYPEIGEVAVALAPLLRLGWVDGRPLLGVDDLFAMLTKSELVSGLMLEAGQAKLPKRALLEHCRQRFVGTRRIEDWCAEFTGRVYHVCVATLCERLRLMYFGNFRQEWSQFVVAELGILTYEQVDCGSEVRPFQTAAQVDQFQVLYRCRQALRQHADPRVVRASMPSPITDSHWLEMRRQRLVFQIGQALERERDIATALEVYSEITYPGAALRCIRIRERTGDANAALTACEAALEAGLADRDVVLVRRARRRLQRRLGLGTAGALPREPVVPTFCLSLDGPAEHRSVEYQVRDALVEHDEGCSSVQYVENSLVNALFGLLCWRAIFAPIPGAFFHKFHREPADLADGGFRRRRESYFADCFADLDQGSYVDTIRGNYQEKMGIATSFVAWRRLTTELLDMALACLPADHLKVWFHWIAEDVMYNRSGFPDLIQFWPHESRYRLIEVKAPGDRLQESQRRCLALCARHQLPAVVCKVQWLAKPTS